MGIVTDTELVSYMSGIRLPPSAVETIPVVLDGTQGQLESWLRYPIDADLPTVTETVTVNRDGRLLTSVWPIAEVMSVDVANDGGPATFTFTPAGDFLIPAPPYDLSGYAVVYRPGLPPRAFAQAKLAIMRVAAREIAPMHDDSRQRDPGGPNSRQPAAAKVGWQPEDLRPFSRWRRRSDSVYSRPQVWGPDVGPTSGDYTTVGTGYGSVSIGGFSEGNATGPEVI